jgi:hypothetical protein
MTTHLSRQEVFDQQPGVRGVRPQGRGQADGGPGHRAAEGEAPLHQVGRGL